MEHVTSISELSVPTATRPRGREAVEKFRQRWPGGNIAVSLDGVALLSLSFLDELITGLARTGDLSRIVFVTDQPRTREKLGRVAALHHGLAIFTRTSGATGAERVAPQPFEPHDPVVEQAKPDHD